MCGRLRAVPVIACVVAVACVACGTSEPRALARQTLSRAELPAGPRALAEPGDYLLENEHVRVVVQAPGFSRGFGVYGGSLIDAVPRSPGEGGRFEGVDAFGELFPAFFLQAVAVDNVEVVSDGTDGGPAVVAASGSAADFLELAGLLNRLATNSHENAADPSSTQRLSYRMEYSLEPGARHVDIRFVVTNISDERLELPGELARPLLSILAGTDEPFTVPVGDVALFGAATDVFIPGAGFDVRFGVEDSYDIPVEFPSFPGLITEFVAARADGVSYLLAAQPSENNFLWVRRDTYGAAAERITQSSLLVPFVASGFLGIFHNSAPSMLEPGDSVVVDKVFVIGTGDVGSALDEYYEVRGIETGRVGGSIIDAVTGAPATDAIVVVYERAPDGTLSPWSQYDPDGLGRFGGRLHPGSYAARVTGDGRPSSEPVPFEVVAGQTAGLTLIAPSAGYLSVSVVDESGALVPSRVSVIGTAPAERAGQEPREWLFDLALGESLRSTDLVPDTADPLTRRYIEQVHVSADGRAHIGVRPGTYTVVASRGMEYTIDTAEVTIPPGGTASLQQHVRRVVDTSGWISFDPHIHTIQSIDSGISLETRAASIASEGLEWAVVTDHNNVTDIRPVVERLGLIPWVKASVGIELTTLESGHFNAYPIDYEVAPVTHGAFEWSNRPPAEIFAELRSMRAPDGPEVIVQANHPRDSIIGYFDQYDRDGRSFEEVPPSGTDQLIAAVTDGGSLSPTGPAFRDAEGNSTFSTEFDALEILNGKLYWQIHHARMAGMFAPGVELPSRPPAPGSILIDDDDEVVLPGAVDDWFNMLNLGIRVAGVGSSDSHGLDDEVGYFRTYVRVTDDDPRAVTEDEIVDAVRNGRIFATNGPILDLWVNDPVTGGIGSELVDTDGEIDLTLRVSAAPWVPVSRVNVYRNGQIVHVAEIERGRDLVADPLVETVTLALAPGEDGEPVDSWFVVEALGYESLFPVVRPLDVPPLNLINAVGALAGPLGLSGEDLVGLVPEEIFPAISIAITNPVWVKLAADRDFIAPGLPSDDERDQLSNDPGFDYNPFDGLVPAVLVDAEEGSGAQPKALDPHFGHEHIDISGTFLAHPSVREVLRMPATTDVDIRRLLGVFECVH